MPSLAALPLFLLLLCTWVPADGFKEHEFKKCNDLGFCRRNRGKPGPRFDMVGVAVQGAVLTATLRNEAAGKDLQLSLRAYADGIVRLTIDEDSTVGRYRIRDIVLPEAEARPQEWHVSARDDGHATLELPSAGGGSDARVLLAFSPFTLSLEVGGVPAVALNSRGLFNFEHRRPNQEGVECDGCFAETFLTFTDSKPKGPEALSLDISFPGYEHVYGIPERATAFALKETTGGEPYRLYNLDVFEYLDESPFGLYGAIPMMLAHKEGLTTGVLWLNAAEMFVDVSLSPDVSPAPARTTHTQWIAESGVVDLFLFVGPRPADVARQYAALTGGTAMPQMFAIGYHQCRWNYKDDADTRAVDAGFDEHEIPYDVIWLDIEHTDGKRYLTWEAHAFPEPQKLQNDVASRSRRTVAIVDPHVKRDPGYYIFSEAQAAGYFVKTKDNTEFEGWCWPGSSSYLDVTNPEVRDWWAQQFTLDKYQGSTQHLYIWNDMNEPSVFNGPEVTMQKDVLHHGGVEHRDVHNLYGLYYHMGTAAGLELRGREVHGDDGDRPFVLSRAFFAGTQRVGPIWTGDNTADWKHLAVSVPMLLSLGVTGLTFSGADVGGFFGNPDAELLIRWYQMGAYYPFFRGHAHLETQRREPWLFGEEATARIRSAIRERYALLPYMYTLFRHANVSGQPVMRPLWYEFPDDKETFGNDKQFMVGPAVLVCPVLSPFSASSAESPNSFALLPTGARWYDARLGAEVSPGSSGWYRLQVSLDGIPVFYRGGSVVPRRERPRRSTQTQARDPFTLVVALDSDGRAAGDLYLDDGRSFGFRRGQYVHRSFTFQNLTLSSSAYVYPDEPTLPVPDGSWTGARGLTVERIVFLGLPLGGNWSVRMPGGQALPLEAGGGGGGGPSSWGAQGALVLRQPRLFVAEDWSVQLVRS